LGMTWQRRAVALWHRAASTHVAGEMLILA